MFIKRTLTIVTVLAVALSTAHIVQADVMYYNGMGLRNPVEVRARYSLVGRDFNTSAGQMKLEYRDVDYLGYCVDAFQGAASAGVTAVPYTTLRNGGLIAYLFETNADSVTTGEQAAGLQVAIWELLYENNDTLDFNLDSGKFQITNSNVIDDANGMLDYMRANMPTDYLPITELTVLRSEYKQDMLIGHNLPVVPEPASATLLAIGGLLVLKRRRRAVRNT